VSQAPNTPPPHEHYRDDLAAYALGALPEGEADELRVHLEECDACRQQLRWLQPAVDLLPRSVHQREPPRRLRTQLMKTVRAESREAARTDLGSGRRRRWWAPLWRPASAVAAIALVAAGAAAGYLLRQPADDSSVIAARAAPGTPGASGTLELQGDSGILRVRGLPSLASNRVYETWVQRDGTVEPSSLFVLRRNHTGDAAVPGPLEGADAVLVTREPRGGSPRPTSPPVLRAQLHQ
jgi:anti-sigma-K factor RskA